MLSLENARSSPDCGLCQLIRQVVHARHGDTNGVEVSIEVTTNGDYHAQAVELEVKKGKFSRRHKLFLNAGIYSSLRV